jgi:hypothetical protein
VSACEAAVGAWLQLEHLPGLDLSVLALGWDDGYGYPAVADLVEHHRRREGGVATQF